MTSNGHPEDTEPVAETAEWAEQLVKDHLDDEPQPGANREQEVLERIERTRRRKPRITDKLITLSHGAGGKATQNLIDALFLEAFRNPMLEVLEDQAVFTVEHQRLAFTTDSYVVSPMFFPGGDIGDLAVNGTVNDLSVSGATPKYLSAGFILEEGLAIADLTKIVHSMAAAAESAGVQIVTGDTKVVEMGKADGCYINTSGVGVFERPIELSAGSAQPGDVVIVSGPIGDHGVTVMLARGHLEIEADIETDTAPLNGLISTLLDATDGVRCLRDATRGGVATVANEIAKASGVALVLDEPAIPVRPVVFGACELLGIDLLYVACEGRMVAVVSGDAADAALTALRSHPLGAEAAVVGTVRDDPPGLVLLNTTFGGTRIVDVLVGDPLPRIC